MKYLEDLKKLRKKILRKTIVILFVLSILVFLPLFYSSGLSISNYIKYIIVLAFIGILIGYWIIKSLCRKDIEHYKNIYAKNIILDILKSNFEDVKYNFKDDLPPKDFVKVIDSAKIPTINSYNSNDYILAKYKNIRIEYSDFSMGYTPRNSDSNYHEHFKGKLLVLSFNKNFKSNIQIGPKIFNGKKNHQMLKGKEYEEIKINDLKLDQKLIIYADNKDEMFNILTPAIINNIKKLYSKVKGKLLIFFINNQIHICIGDKNDFFEPSIYKKFNLDKEKDKIQKQIEIIIDFINYWI